MLTSVPVAHNRAHRIVVLRHPNSIEAIVSRKRVVRVERDPSSGLPSESSGQPTLGGLGVLRSEDETDIEYVELGEAKCLFVGPFTPTDMVERDNGLVPSLLKEATVECKAAPGDPSYFEADSGDLVLLTMGMGVVVAFEVASVSSPLGIAPYMRKIMLNPRDDLSYLEPFDGLQ